MAVNFTMTPYHFSRQKAIPHLRSNYTGSMQQFHQTRFVRKTFCQRLIERCQTESMLPGQRDEIAVGDLICASHQFRPHDAVGATQVVGNELMARVGDELAENAKSQFGRRAVTEQGMRGHARKTKLGHRAGRKGGNALEPRTGLGVMLVIFPKQRHEQVDIKQSGHGVPLSIS